MFTTMKVSAIGFSNRGTIRQQNEDAILMHTDVFQSGMHHFETDDTARFFVADGVGGAPAGNVASKYVLHQLNKNIDAAVFPDQDVLIEAALRINMSLFDYCSSHPPCSGMASTLSGLFISDESYRVLNAGDSCTLLFRDQKLIQITTSDEIRVYPDSMVLANYFGGYQQSLVPKVVSGDSQLRNGDVFIVSTDGLFHCFPVARLEKVLANSRPLHEKARAILEKSLEMGSPDNISCIFISITA